MALHNTNQPIAQDMSDYVITEIEKFNDIFDADKMRTIFKSFAKNPSANWVSIYNAMEYDPSPEEPQDDNFEKFAQKWQSHPDLFKKGYEPYIPSESNAGFYHVMDANYGLQERKHRIYINPSQEQRPEFVHTLIKKCIQNNVEYYFKYSRTTNRLDNLVIYASDEQLNSYSKIFREIEQETPDLIDGCRDLPLSAQQACWFGYGVEDNSSEKGSYTARIAKIVRKNITKHLMQNRDLFNPKDITADKIQKLCEYSLQATVERTQDEKTKADLTHGLKIKEQSQKVFAQYAEDIIKNIFSISIKGKEEKIANDDPIMNVICGGQTISITPSAITTMFSSMRPRFANDKEREKFYEQLASMCNTDLNEEKLSKAIPEVLTNYNKENQHQI